MTAPDLVDRVLAGDPRAQREFYDLHVDRVYRLAFRLTGDPDLAAEGTQETFIRVFRKLDTFRGEAAVSTWVTSVAYSVVYNGMRKRSRSVQREVELDPGLESRQTGAIDPDLRATLHQAIDELPESYRAVFLMHDLEGYTHGEIGEALGIPEGTSKAQLSRARARLRVALKKFSVGWS